MKNKIHFEISERKVLLRIFDIVFVLLGLNLVSSIFNFEYFQISEVHWLWSIFLILYLMLFATIFELYNLQKTNSFDKVFKNIVLTTSVTVLFYLFTPFYTPSLPENRLQIVYFYLALLGALCLWRLVYIYFISSPRFYKNVLIIGDSLDIDKITHDLQNADPNYIVAGYINTNEIQEGERLSDVEHIALENFLDSIQDHQIREVVVFNSFGKSISKQLYSDLIGLLESGFSIREYSQVYEELTYRIPVDHLEMDFYKYFPFSRSNQNKLYLFFHRLFDILIALIGIFIGLCLSPLIILGNMLGNRGPLFYSQERVGRNGRIFKILKFRTMIVNAEVNGAQWAQANDMRITKFGKFLRKSRLDEIPQFFNILKGEMSTIGPRPERPMFVKKLAETISFYEIRHVIQPGLTGWAQVNTPYGATKEDSLKKLQYDLYYIKHRSLFLDLKIMVKTLSTVIFFRGQ